MFVVCLLGAAAILFLTGGALWPVSAVLLVGGLLMRGPDQVLADRSVEPDKGCAAGCLEAAILLAMVAVIFGVLL